MSSKHRHLSNDTYPQDGVISTSDHQSLTELFSDVISLKMLQFLQIQMQPHHKHFNVVDVALIVDRYIDSHLLKKDKEPEKERGEVLGSLSLPLEPKLMRNLSQNAHGHTPFEIKRQQTFQMLLEQLKTIFLYYAAHSLNYEMLNEYIYNQQLNCLSNGQVDEDYIQIGEKRVRIDENVKLCIMPLAEEGVDITTTKIKQLVFRQNQRGAELQSIYAVTNEYIRCIHIKPELIGIASDFNRKGDANACWYQYQNQLIKPKRNTLSVLSKTEENVVLNSAELKQLKATNATNLEQKFSEQLLKILKVCLSENLMGIVSLDQSFIVEPIANGKSRIMQGYIGNLIRDIPPQISLSEVSKDKYQEILLFHSYSDTEWLILTTKFLYFYRIPLPVENIILREQNNLHKASTYKPNPLLLMCQRLPKGCIKAMTLIRPFICIMLSNNSIIIIKLIINSLGVFENKALNLDMNYFKITNKIYNDIQFKCMCFNQTFNNIFLTDFGAYLIRISFNKTYGDIEEEGITHDRQDSNQLNQEMVRNSYSELKVSKHKMGRNKVIHEVDDEEGDTYSNNQYIQVFYLKPTREQQNHLFSIYKKQSTSPHTVIIKNQTRQVITYVTTNHNYNTLITYESQSYEKKTGSDFQGEKYREWGNRNKIKLWDIRHMTIYKTYDISVEIAFLELRANGLFAITADRGYLVLYPFNQDRKALMTSAEQRLLDKNSKEVTQELEDVFLENNSLYFSATTTAFNKYNNLKIHKTHIYQMKLQKYPQIKLLQSLPSEISALAVKSRIYVLENSTQGVEASQLHIYNRLGLKQEMIIFSNSQSVSSQGKINQQNYNQQYKFLKRILHQQFQVVIWNNDSLKMIGNSRQESYTIIFSSPKINHVGEGMERMRTIKDIQVVGESMIIYCENTTRIREKVNSIQTVSKVSENTERRSNNRDKIQKIHEHTDNSIILISNQSDRITYRLEHISPHIKVLHMFNSLILTREEDGDYDLIKVLDVGQHGDLIEKMLFTAKYRRTTVERMRARDLKEQQFYELEAEKNILLQELKEYSVRKLISLEDTKIAVTKNNKLILLLVFKVETHYADLLTKKIIKSELEFMVYARNISDELFNTNYKISKIQVGKKTEKHLYEYQTTATRGESIFGHKVLSIDDCFAISNYTEIDMQQLCEAIDSEKGRKYAGIDITEKIFEPKNINNNYIKDIYEILSLKKDKKLYEIFQQYPSQISAINAFTFKIIQFSDEQLNGTISISNKLLRTIGLYSFQIDCSRKEAAVKHDLNDKIQDPYQLQLILEKISLLEVKSHREIRQEQQVKKSDPSLSKQQIQHIKLLDWSGNYKSSVEEMWETTVSNIKMFIYNEKLRELQQKRSISLPPIKLHQLNTLQIKKKEMLKKKLTTSERNMPELGVKRLETEGASLMFKKWTISQAIHLEKSTRDANNITEIKAVNRYVNKVLKSEDDTAERVQELIKNTQKIKQASQTNPSYSITQRDRSISMKVDEQLAKDRQMNISHLDNILRSSEIAKESNIKSYLQHKNNLKTITNASSAKCDYSKLSRNDTNKSSLTTEIDKGKVPPRTDSRTDIRVTSLSKMSNHTNHSRRTKGGQFDTIDNSNSLDYKIKIKLEQIQQKSPTQRKIMQNLKFYTPERQLKGMQDSTFNMNRLKTQKSRYNDSSPISKQKIIRFATQENEDNVVHKPSSQYQNSLSYTPQQEGTQSLTKNRIDKISKFEDYKSNFTLMGSKNRYDVKEEEQRKNIHETEQFRKKQSAVERLKRSQQLMNDIYLPQIASTKQKLMRKMKEKRSYVKTIQAHLHDSSLMTIRQGQRRKELIKQLHEFK